MAQHSSIRTISLISALVLIWGLSWPVYKIALPYTPPLLFAGLRTLLGGMGLALFLLHRWKKIQFKKNLRIYIVSAFFNVFLFFGFQTVGLNFLPGGLFSVIVYFQPVLVGVLAWRILGEPMSWQKIIGLVFGFFGVIAVGADGITMEFSFTGIMLALLTSISWAIGIIYFKKEAGKTDALWLVAIQFIIGGTILTSIGFAVESWSEIVWNAQYITGMLFGSILGVSTAWVIYFTLVRSGEASKVAASTFIVPLISVSGSTLFLKEPFNPLLFWGLLLIVLSIYLVNRKTATTESYHARSE
ncbi:DMT family transporter [Ferviditalea candida]|uniref:DMT family transporter n=1 Tax=Ferviditalea candida TaxID=3108399 RepID=A0ABU5ZLU4_9BACL|nr:DMT family transporter [Paenibacillaceae bacterium T2]